MTFCDDAWTATTSIRASINGHPFLTGLSDGSLDRATFNAYITQDAIYLGHYGRALANLAANTTDPDELVFWAGSARDSIVVERQLHESEGVDKDATAHPSCVAYTSFLLSHSLTSYGAGVAAVLPCFWVYSDVGQRILAITKDVTDHPYAAWIATYADKAFAQSVEQAKAIANRAAEDGGAVVKRAMIDAFVTATKYEYMFWDAAWRAEQWPV